jgi:hypothetical protein
MHFGLYAFDLFEAIYEEAWDKGLCPTLQEAYSEKGDYLRDVPRLIIEHNIHGVDIDPRAVQIAGLSLWLRAQRSWEDTPAPQRPRVRRSNIVCAEPMPGSDAMLEEFIQTLDPPLLGELVKTVFDKMQLAGEAGTLLKIEVEIRTAIDEARREWAKLQSRHPELFSNEEIGGLSGQPVLSNLDSALNASDSQLTSDFFDTAEECIYTALQNYAVSAEAGDNQRRLFAEDAAQGFSFIDLCRKRYDAVVMNPPFGEPSRSTKQIIKTDYPDIGGDILQAFIQLGLDLVEERGVVGAITARTGFFMGNSEPWRENVIFQRNLRAFADLGLGVLDDALVEAAAYIIEDSNPDGSRTFACRQLDVRDTKAEILLQSINSYGEGLLVLNRSFMPSYRLIANVPGKAFAYWAPDVFLRRFSGTSQTRLDVRQGLATADDFRYARLAWETPFSSSVYEQRWQPFSKGGEYSPGFDDVHLRVDWDNNGAALKSTDSSRVQNEKYYYRLGATYTVRTASAFAAKLLPKGTIFSHNAQSWFLEKDAVLLASIGYFSTRVAQTFIELAVGGGDISTSGSAARRYTTQVIEGIPFISDNDSLSVALSELGKKLVHASFSKLIDEESSGLFTASFTATSSLTETTRTKVDRLLDCAVSTLETASHVDQELIATFDLSSEEVDFVTAETGDDVMSFPENVISAEDAELGKLSTENLIEKVVSEDGAKIWYTKKCYLADRRLEILSRYLRIHPKSVSTAIRDSLVDSQLLDVGESLISNLLGYALGRWDIRYATDERQPPELPDPFDPLPVCPPGMLQNADGLPAAPADVPDDYPLRISWPGILVDDDGHYEDIVARVRDALSVLWGDRASAIEQEACDILGVRTLRDYFAEKKSGGKFFKDHLKRYSKSRRQAPIYWPLSTESGTYTLWIYYHRLDDQTLYSCVNNFVEPKLELTVNELSTLRSKSTRSSQEEKQLERLSDLEGELKDFRDELLRLAKFWKPNLNDGVQITAAPLWNLFRDKAWQKKLKQTWESLEKGEYDWAHLAGSIWPERVLRKCHEDRSLAIAHGVEDDLWIEQKTPTKKGAKMEWKPKSLSDSEISTWIETKAAEMRR